MWIVRLALRRPYTFVVMAVLIAILGTSAIVTMPVDIFPYIDIPVVSVVWSYGGLRRGDGKAHGHHLRARHDHHGKRYRAHRIAILQRRFGDARIFPAQCQGRTGAFTGDGASRRPCCASFRPARTPPSIIKYDASSVPILQLGSDSKTLASRSCSTSARTSSGRSWPPSRAPPFRCPIGGKFRKVMVDLNPDQLYAKGLSPTDISNALSIPEPDSAGGRPPRSAIGLSGESTAARGFWTR